VGNSTGDWRQDERALSFQHFALSGIQAGELLMTPLLIDEICGIGHEVILVL